MPVTKQVYTANAPWTGTDLANLLRSALIDAGLMTEWHDSFTVSPGGTPHPVRVLKVTHNATKTYGSSFYYFSFPGGPIQASCRVSLASGWNPSGTPPVNVPTGTQYLDYHTLPANIAGGSGESTLVFNGSVTSNVSLERYTSALDTKQSWFVFTQGTSTSDPFTILHAGTALQPWLDLDRGLISGYSTVATSVISHMGTLRFQLQENIRRALLVGSALRGETNGIERFHDMRYNAHCYIGVGAKSASASENLGEDVSGSAANGAGVILPVGKNSANPAFVTDYVPICSDLPWSPFTPTRLATDFGVCMYFADNTLAYGNRLVIQSAINEWEILKVTNNAAVNDGASPLFLARII